MLDLDKARDERIAARAAAAIHEGSGETLPIRWRGETIAELAPEAPLSTLAPLRRIDSEIGMLISGALRSAKADGDGVLDIVSLLADLVAMNENFPTEIVSVVEDIATAALGSDGLARFLAGSPSIQDVIAIAKGALSWWGITLGEASRSSDSSANGGPTSNPTSSTTTTSTYEASGSGQVTSGSSESAGSLS